MKLRAYLSIILLIFLSISCKKKNEVGAAQNYRFEGSFNVDGISRTYTVNLPPNYYEGSDFSLVIAMHGGGGSGLQFETSSLLTQKANASNFIVVYPDGVTSTGLLALKTWNAGNCCGYAVTNNINDVGFISQLTDKLLATYKINPKKVYATGHSNGGMMAYRLACELSNKIAAIAVSACTMVNNQPCSPTHAVPILHVHSNLDQNVPIAGGIGIGISNVNYPPVLSGLQTWVSLNNCPIPQKTILNNTNYTLTQWVNCTNNSSIQYYLTNDGGHAWAGGLPGTITGDLPSSAVNMNNLLWDFFKQYQLP